MMQVDTYRSVFMSVARMYVYLGPSCTWGPKHLTSPGRTILLTPQTFPVSSCFVIGTTSHPDFPSLPTEILGDLQQTAPPPGRLPSTLPCLLFSQL